MADVNARHREHEFKRSTEFRARQNYELDAIGYHFFIYISDIVATARNLDEVGAHAQGYNQKSIGVCMAGTDKFTPDQWDRLRANVSLLMERYRAERG